MKRTSRLSADTIALLRELEAHLASVEINVNGHTVPYAGINCARHIMRDLLSAVGLTPDPDLPEIVDMELEAPL